MYLKSIEIQGFKSFANKILFEFHNGITGIVGPNGSGKSNVADAVRWVLGEQRSRQLRGGTMQDVIFAGTELRKPQGFAYVAITLDNADHKLPIEYDEVTVSRRLYRSGESEYKINGTSCRLKDINELFYDTGIGKEGYSIIGQGQIDQILSGRPEERRELFDEAAGIVKFKRRKAIAQKKLEDEKQNLIRVTDFVRAGKTGRTVGTAVGGGEGVSASAGRAALPGRQPVFGRIGGIEAPDPGSGAEGDDSDRRSGECAGGIGDTEIGVRIARNRAGCAGCGDCRGA